MTRSVTHISHREDYRLFCQERLADPYPLYRELRQADPVHWCEPMKLWLVTGYQQVLAGMKDERFSASRMGMYTRPLSGQVRQHVEPLLRHISKWILLTDEPDHGRLRKLVNLAFTPRMLQKLRPRIEQVVADLLPPPDALTPGSRYDVLNSFCYPLPATVICEMLGIPQDQRESFRICTERLVAFSSRGGPELARHAEDAMAALTTLIGMFEPLIEQHRRTPREDLMSALISAEDGGQRLGNEELFAMCVFIFLAGHETTTNIMASAILLLLRHPDQLAMLRGDLAGRLPAVIEECLRFEPSVPRAVRQARHDLQLDGKSIQQNDTVVFMIAAANRDPAVFERPDHFDIRRWPNKHLSFGFGPHFCLGAQLARLELEVSLAALLKRFCEMSLSTTDIQWKPLMGIRALRELEIVVGAS